uniref:Uncharacterized protein n=1 Tax=Arundo donax TaxID=35708 RepID=A0A0A9D723_ARUDO
MIALAVAALQLQLQPPSSYELKREEKRRLWAFTKSLPCG